MPEVTITVPAQEVGTFRSNAVFVGEELGQGFDGVSPADVDSLLDQLDRSAESRDVAVTAEPLALWHVIGGCLVEVGGEADDVCQSKVPEPSELRAIAARLEWFARALDLLRADVVREPHVDPNHPAMRAVAAVFEAAEGFGLTREEVASIAREALARCSPHGPIAEAVIEALARRIETREDH
jgi:hypothetical protein